MECKLEFPSWINENTKDLILKMLTFDTKKRIKFDEIKNHSFYKKGEGLIKKEERSLTESIKVDEFVLETMIDLGIPKEETLRNIKQKKHNNITTTYHLLVNKYTLNPNLILKAEEEKKNIDNNKNIIDDRIKNLSPKSINSHDVTNTNLIKTKQSFFLNQIRIYNGSTFENSTLFNNTAKLEKPPNPFKTKNSTEISANTSNLISNSISENKNVTPILEKFDKNFLKEYNLH